MTVVVENIAPSGRLLEERGFVMTPPLRSMSSHSSRTCEPAIPVALDAREAVSVLARLCDKFDVDSLLRDGSFASVVGDIKIQAATCLHGFSVEHGVAHAAIDESAPAAQKGGS